LNNNFTNSESVVFLLYILDRTRGWAGFRINYALTTQGGGMQGS